MVQMKRTAVLGFPAVDCLAAMRQQHLEVAMRCMCRRFVLVSLLCLVSAAVRAQAPQIQMSAAEYGSYSSAMAQTTQQTKAAALEAYLAAYPQSVVKEDVLQLIMIAYNSFDQVKALDTADRLLQVDPDNLRALVDEVYIRKASADKITDAGEKQAALDIVTQFAQMGLAANSPNQARDADFKVVQPEAYPIFYGAIGEDALIKGDSATAIANFRNEFGLLAPATTVQPGPALQDTYYLAEAYEKASPPDLVNCAYYAARATAYAPAPFKSQMEPLGKWCYQKQHGNLDGYDTMVSSAKAKS